MKKSMILIFAVILLIANNIYAQDSDNDDRKKLKIGAKVGFNYSNVYDTEGEEFDADAKIGLVIGGFVSIPIGEYIGIQPELLFTQKGFSSTGKVLGFNYDLTRTTYHLDIPILFALKPSPYITILAGPQYSYLIKQNDNFDNPISNFDIEKEFDNDNIRENTLCFLGGFDLNLNNFVIGARVGWDLFNNNGDGTTTTPRYKNTWVQLTFGINLIQL